MKFRSILLSAAALTCATAAQAQNNSTRTTPEVSSSRIFGSVTSVDLRALVVAEGHTVDAIDPVTSPSVRGRTEDGKLFLLIGTACDTDAVPGCLGIMMQMRYDSDESVTFAGVNDANINEASLNTWWDQANNTVGFTRYVVLDDGVSWMNLRQNLRVLLDVSGAALTYVFP